MMENKIQIITAIGNVLGLIFTLLFQQLKSKPFKKDFNKFKKALENHFDTNIKKRIIKLAQDKKLELDSFKKYFSDEVSKINTINDLKKDYFQIRKRLNWGLIIFLISLSITVLGIFTNIKIIFPLENIGLFILIGAIILFIYNWYQFCKIEHDLDKFFFGEPIEKIIEKRSDEIYGLESKKL